MPIDAYQELLSQVQLLSFEEQLQLLEDLLNMLNRSSATMPQHLMVELERLNKETWVGINVKQYLEDERNLWDKSLS